MTKKDKTRYVYCTNCERCKLDMDARTNCGFEGECDSFTPEDSKPSYKRPHYKESEEIALFY